MVWSTTYQSLSLHTAFLSDRNPWIYTYIYIYIYINIYIYIERYIYKAKLFLRSHHTCNRTPRTSRLVPSHRAWRGGRGDDFDGCNQSLTALASALFRQQVGYLAESSLTLELEDTWRLLSEGLTVLLDRRNAWRCGKYRYLQVLPTCVNQQRQPVAVYSIHDTVEPFRCKNDLRHCGKFYIDETTFNNYGLPIKIEAGFYSSNLVNCLVDFLKMPTSQIK